MLFKEWAGEGDQLQSRNYFRVGSLKYKELWFYVLLFMNKKPMSKSNFVLLEFIAE